MTFRLTGLNADAFADFVGRPDAELAACGAVRLIAEEGYPCRVTLADVPPGEPVLLVPFEHVPAPSAYRSSGPIFVRDGRYDTAIVEDRIPTEMRPRLYSVRAYGEHDWMIDADVATGADLEPLINRFFARDDIRYLHLHHARRGCFACRVDRA